MPAMVLRPFFWIITLVVAIAISTATIARIM